MKARRLAAAIAASLVTLAVTASGASAWAPASSATVHPGIQTFTQGAQPAAEITDAKVVDPTTISFKRSVQGRGGGEAIQIEYTGKIKGDEMTLTPNLAGRGGGGGGRGPTEITLKRAS